MSETRPIRGSNNRIAERDYYEIRGSIYTLPPSIDGHLPRLILCPLHSTRTSNAGRSSDCLNCLKRHQHRRRRRVIDRAFVCVSLTTTAWLLTLFLLAEPNVPPVAIIAGLLLQATCMIRLAVRLWRRRPP